MPFSKILISSEVLPNHELFDIRVSLILDCCMCRYATNGPNGWSYGPDGWPNDANEAYDGWSTSSATNDELRQFQYKPVQFNLELLVWLKNDVLVTCVCIFLRDRLVNRQAC